MADLDANLRTFLLADSPVSTVTTNVHVNSVPDNKTKPYIWIQLDDENQELNLGAASGLTTAFYDCEATSTSLSTAKDLAAKIKTALHAHSGAVGDQNVAYMEVTSRDDTYETRQDFGDSKNLHVSALTIEIGVDGR